MYKCTPRRYHTTKGQSNSLCTYGPDGDDTLDFGDVRIFGPKSICLFFVFFFYKNCIFEVLHGARIGPGGAGVGVLEPVESSPPPWGPEAARGLQHCQLRRPKWNTRTREVPLMFHGNMRKCEASAIYPNALPPNQAGDAWLRFHFVDQAQQHMHPNMHFVAAMQ